MFEGEDGIYTEKAKEEGAEPVKQEGAFNEANVWARIATVFAGPFFNMILAFLLALIESDLPALRNLPKCINGRLSRSRGRTGSRRCYYTY